jgi:tetratricopeptide (TPR) repeat protein
LYHTRASVQLERGERVAARRDFEQAIALEPRGSQSERLASDYVELGHLKHWAGEFESALAAIHEALRVCPDYPPAHRQRAETLLALERYAEAGNTLDQYLKAGGVPTPEVYEARGLIHSQLREYPEAVEAYTAALKLRRDAAMLVHRGRAYLRLQAPRAALADFEAALRLHPSHAPALCYRGHARLALGQIANALADAEEALRCGPQTDLLLFNTACLYARAADQAEVSGPAALQDTPWHCRERAVGLLRKMLEQMPRERRAAFWRETVAVEPSLASLRGSGIMGALARTYGQ